LDQGVGIVAHADPHLRGTFAQACSMVTRATTVGSPGPDSKQGSSSEGYSPNAGCGSARSLETTAATGSSKGRDRQKAGSKDRPDSAESARRSSQLVAWATQCSERAARFRLEGRVPLARSQMERCAQHLQFALLCCPNNLSARFFLVGCLMSLGQHVKAKEQALVAIGEINEDRCAWLQHPILHIAVALSCSSLGHGEEALAHLQRAAVDYPLHAQPCAALGLLLSRTGNNDACSKIAQLALDRDDDPRCPCRLSQFERQTVISCLNRKEATSEKGNRWLFDGETQFASVLRELSRIGEDAASSAARPFVQNRRPPSREASTTASVPPSRNSSSPGIRVDRVSGDDDLPTDRQDTRSGDSLYVGLPLLAATAATEPDSPRQAAQLEHLQSHELAARDGFTLPKAGRYVAAKGELFVRAAPSASAEKVSTLTQFKVATITSFEFSDKDGYVWGRVSESSGWVPVFDVRGGRNFAREANAEEAAVDPPRLRSLPFGPVDNQAGAVQGAAALRKAAMDDFERILSGLMPASRTEPLEGTEEAGSGDAMSRLRPMCAACAVCCSCNCRRGCEQV